MLEKMDEFFHARLDGYEEHQLNAIDSAGEFYPFTAECLPREPGISLLDLGCGTGLELEYYFPLNPTAKVTGIDLAEKMLKVLVEKFPRRPVTVIAGSYFDVPFGEEQYDAVVSVESLHHFLKAEKVVLYRKVFQALVPRGYFILTDYFAPSEKEETFFREELSRLKGEQGICDDAFYHYDTPLTIEHEIEALREAGFPAVEILGRWGATGTIKASREESR